MNFNYCIGCRCASLFLAILPIATKKLKAHRQGSNAKIKIRFNGFWWLLVVIENFQNAIALIKKRVFTSSWVIQKRRK